MTLALRRSAYSMVGRVSRMRVSSVITPSLIGTLKSTRIKTRLWARSRSRMESLAMRSRIRQSGKCVLRGPSENA